LHLRANTIAASIFVDAQVVSKWIYIGGLNRWKAATILRFNQDSANRTRFRNGKRKWCRWRDTIFGTSSSTTNPKPTFDSPSSASIYNIHETRLRLQNHSFTQTEGQATLGSEPYVLLARCISCSRTSTRANCASNQRTFTAASEAAD
jgi:hypothetical protein